MYHATIVIKRPDQVELETASINDTIEFKLSAFHAINVMSDEYSNYSISVETTYEEIEEWLSHNVALREMEKELARVCLNNDWTHLVGYRSAFRLASGEKDEFIISFMDSHNLDEFRFDTEDGILLWTER